MQSGVQLRLADNGGEAALIVCGAPEDSDLSIVPSEFVERGSGWQATAGSFDEQDGAWRFVPRFPLVRGSSYSLLIDGVESARTQVPAPASTPSTDVVSIDPTAEVLPLNLLRVYVNFSAPMSEGYATSAVSVRRLDTGEPLEDVFVQMEPELWNRSRRRLTLLLEPGRIKRGLIANLEAGPPLTEGVSVAVGVDRSFRDAAGRPLRAPAERLYSIGPAIRARIDPDGWRVSAPGGRSRAALVVGFDRPLDIALLRRFLSVRDATMSPVGGQATIDEGDRSWRFTPASPWRAGPYTLRVDTRLEDVAGNSVRRVFDRDLRLPDHEPLNADFVSVQFTIS